MDKKDKLIVEQLQVNADLRIHQMEKEVMLPRSTIHHRIQKLKREGVITKIKAVVDPDKIGLPVCVLIHIVVSLYLFS